MIAAVGGSAAQSSNRMELPPIKKEQVEVDATYIPATIEIKKRDPEIIVELDSAREEIGYLRPYAQMREIRNMAQQALMEGISDRVQAGLRIRNIHKEQGNVFGRIAFEQFLADRKKEIRIDAAPRFGANIDVRIYPLDITVDTNVKGGANYF